MQRLQYINYEINNSFLIICKYLISGDVTIRYDIGSIHACELCFIGLAFKLVSSKDPVLRYQVGYK